MAQKGDDLLKTLNSTFISQLQALVNKHGQGEAVFEEKQQFDTVLVENSTTTAFGKFEAIGLGVNVINYSNNDHRLNRIIYEGEVLDHEQHQENWVILQQPLPGRVGAVAEGLMVGVSWVKTEFDVGGGSYLKINADDVLDLASSGKAYGFVSYPDGLGRYNTLCIIGGASSGEGNQWSRFELTSDLAAIVGSTATAIFQDASTGTVVNTGTWRAFTGAIGVAVLVGGVWSIITVQQPADFTVELTDNSPIPDYPTPDGTVTVLPGTRQIIGTYPHDFNFTLPAEIPNPNNLASHDGDIGTVRWDQASDGYILTHVAPARQKMFWAKLTADCPLGLYANVDITPLDLGHLGNGEYDPATRTADEYPQVAVDLFNKAHNAKENHKCLVVLDPDAGTYKILECDHIATHWLGTVYMDFDSHPDTFEVEFVRAYNGQDVPGVTIEIENRWKYEAMLAGEKIDILFDPVTGVWYPMEPECTDDFNPYFF